MTRNNTAMAFTLAGAMVLAAILPVCGTAEELVPPQAAEFAPMRAHRSAALEGVWDSTVTLLVCGQQVEIRKFRALNLFEQGGALVATSEIAPPPSLGKWRWLGGSKYRAQFRFQRFGASGVFEGITQVTREIELAKSGDAFTGVVSTRLFDVFDNLIGEGCGKEIAKRAF